ncbi:hypothetical protein ACW14X_27960 [Nocardioides sp. YJ-D4]
MTDSTRAQVDQLQSQIADLRSAEATARPERDAAKADVELERQHATERIEDVRTGLTEQRAEVAPRPSSTARNSPPPGPTRRTVLAAARKRRSDAIPKLAWRVRDLLP